MKNRMLNCNPTHILINKLQLINKKLKFLLITPNHWMDNIEVVFELNSRVHSTQKKSPINFGHLYFQ